MWHIDSAVCFHIVCAIRQNTSRLACGNEASTKWIFGTALIYFSLRYWINHATELLVCLYLIRFWQCIVVAAKTFSNKLVAFLLQKLELSSKDEKMRIGALSIIRHLVNAAGSFHTLYCSWSECLWLVACVTLLFCWTEWYSVFSVLALLVGWQEGHLACNCSLASVVPKGYLCGPNLTWNSSGKTWLFKQKF